MSATTSPVVNDSAGTYLQTLNESVLSATNTARLRIESCDLSGFSFTSIEKTHLGSTFYREHFRSDLAELGEAKISAQLNPDQQFKYTTNPSDTLVLQFPVFGTNTGTTTTATNATSFDIFSGFFLSRDITIPPAGGKMMMTATFKFDGGYTHVTSS